MKGNGHKKLFQIDRFARKNYCPHARLNQLRSDKRRAKRTVRRTVFRNGSEGDEGGSEKA